MAILIASTFVRETELLNKVRDALRNLTGFSSTEAAIKANLPVDYPFPVGPHGRLFRLDDDKDFLDPTYRSIWKQCTIQYDPIEPGAEIKVLERKMRLGPAMRHYIVNDLEKVIIHEYMHAALDATWQRETDVVQHGPINETIQFHLFYPGHPNPANPAEGQQDD
jgi:hypothetical protein